MKKPVLGLLISVFIGILPILSLLLASAIAAYNDCNLNEGNINPCVVLGHDWGEMLYSMAVFAWLSFATLPIGLLGVLICIIWLLVLRFRS